jgi:hypothetical protein
MADDLISFSWPVFEGGYRIIEGSRNDRSEKAVIEDVTVPSRYRRYSPVKDHPALYRTFAAMPATPEAIIAFANSYGLLGLPVRYDVFEGDEGDSWFNRTVHAEPLTMWRETITAMNAAVELWDLLRKVRTSPGRLRHVVRQWERHAEIFPLSVSTPIAGTPAPQGGLQAGADEAFARFEEHLERERWRSAGWTMLGLLIGGYLQAHVALSVELRPREDGLDMVLAPRRLLGALWLQLGDAVTGKVQHRLCEAENCGRWFEVSTRQEGKRRNREFCSDACRVRMFRHRKAEARRLAAAGKPLKEIASSLGSTVATVRGWTRKR